MGKKVSIAERLEKLGHDPLEVMVRMSDAAEKAGNLALVAKVNADLLEYCAPKLKAVEHSIDPETLDALMTPEMRRARIKALSQQVGLAIPQDRVIEGTVVPINKPQEKP